MTSKTNNIKNKGFLHFLKKILSNKTFLMAFAAFSGISIGAMIRLNFPIVTLINIQNVYDIGGRLFISTLKMIAGPLVFFSISKGITSGGKSDRFFVAIFMMFFLFTIASILISLCVAFVIKPWDYFLAESVASSANLKSYQSSQAHISLIYILKNIIPSSFLDPFLTGNIMQIIFISSIISIAAKKTKHKKSFLEFVSKADDIMIKLGSGVIQLSPIPIFSFLLWMVATQELKLLKSLGFMVLTLYISCAIVMYVLYPLIILCTRLNPIKAIKKMLHLQLISYIIDSSSSLIPFSLKLSSNLGIDKKISNIVIPLGSTINMNGSAMYITLSVIFLSKISNINLDYTQIIMLIGFSTISAVGTAPIPGSATIFVISVSSVFGIPPESIGILLAIDRIMDMARTSVNVSADVVVSIVISKITKTLKISEYNKS